MAVRKKASRKFRQWIAVAVVLMFVAAWQALFVHSKVALQTVDSKAPLLVPSEATLKSDWVAEIFPWRHIRPKSGPIVIEDYKLLFFDTPKVASSTFKRLFYSMNGHPKWSGIADEKKERWIRPKENNLTYFGNCSRAQQKEILRSPEWTRAAFVRDPMERVLSAYLNKGLGRDNFGDTGPVAGDYIKRSCCNLRPGLSDEAKPLIEAGLQKDQPHCLKIFPYERELTPDNFPFSTFVEDFMPNCIDPHWSPQSDRIPAAAWKFINFVGHVETIHQDGNALLRRIGAYDDFAGGWGPHQNESLFEKNRAFHSTNARKNNFRDYVGTDKIERQLLEYYRVDYDNPMMNLTKPKS